MKKIIIALTLILLMTGCGRQNEASSTETPTVTPAGISSGTPEPEEKSIEQTALDLVNDISEGNFDKAFKDYDYDDTMSNLISEAFFRDQFWGFFTASFGQFKEITGTVSQKHEQYDIVGVKTTFENAKIYVNVVFENNKIAGLNYVMDNAAADIPGDIIETQITFGKSGWELPGILTTPREGSGFPVVVLVHGSGPNDRDETIGPNKPFRDIAWELAKQGIASFRYDKRTYVHGSRMAASDVGTVYEETIEDAVLASELLKERQGINSERIYILGHSLGGMLIPRIAEETPDAAGYIIAAGPVTPLQDLMVEQAEYLSGLDGSISDEESKLLESYRIMRNNVNELTAGSQTASSDIFGLPASYWLDLKEYSPGETAESIDKPLLILQGNRDYQVPEREFRLWQEALSSKENVSFQLFDGLNHLFLRGTGKPSPQEYSVPGKVDEEVTNSISSWINGIV